MDRHLISVDRTHAIVAIRDYASNLKSPYEREIATRYLDGESLKVLAGAYNMTQTALKSDLREAFIGLSDMV